MRRLALSDRKLREEITMQPITVHTVDPLSDLRWPEFILRNSNASVFHSLGWLRALQRTYGYEPIVFTTSAPDEELRNALLFCSVRSWLTGSRLVSLPFSDHCEPLVESHEELNLLRLFVEDIGKRQRCKYVEIRPTSSHMTFEGGFQKAETFYLHRLNLRPAPDALLRSFHKDCVQRKIRRAEREGLTYEVGRSELHVQKLYGLLQRTRRRHHLPPQPLHWFRNVVECVGEDACIRIASKHGQPVAGILTLSHGKKMIYKYGGSDAHFNNLGGMPMLFWKAIQEGKQAGAEELDFGRSECDNTGLIAFKEHWSAERLPLTYWRYPGIAKPVLSEGRKIRYAKRLFARLPDSVMALSGKLLYRHIG